MDETIFPGIITVRTNSSRLPKKCLLNFGGITVIQHIIERCFHYSIDPIICTTLDHSDDILEEIALRNKIKIYRGSTINKLQRWSECATRFDLKYFHTIDADDPFFDGVEMKKSMDLLVSSHSDVIFPSLKSSSGHASVGFSFIKSAINELNNKFSGELNTEYIWEFIDKMPSLKTNILPDNEGKSLDLRLTLDYEEDFMLLEVIRSLLGNFASRMEIDELLANNPDLYKINWHRNEEFLKNQGKID